jgi:hypothetical protein
MKARIEYKVVVRVYQDVELSEEEFKDIKTSRKIYENTALYNRVTEQVKIGQIEWWGDIEELKIDKK